MPRVHFVKAARKDYPRFNITKGQSYFHWTFRLPRRGGALKMMSTTRPTQSQLTRSTYKSELLRAIEEANSVMRKDGMTLRARAQQVGELLLGTLESLKEACEESLSNMPEQFHGASQSAILLEDRISTLGDVIDDINDMVADLDNTYETHDQYVEAMEGGFELMVERCQDAAI